MQKRLFFMLLGALALIVGAWGWYDWRTEQNVPASANAFPHVVTTFFPITEFAHAVIGDLGLVTQVIPEGVEPHAYEPSSRDIATMLDADVVIVYGGGMDPWAEKLLPDLYKAGIRIVRIDEVISLNAGENGEADPHAWLDPFYAQDMVNAIASALSDVDAPHAQTYQTHAEIYKGKLATLHDVFAESLQNCAQKDIFVAHDAFGYWKARYAITVHAIAGLSPEAEPSVQDMTRVIEDARLFGATTIFFEDREGAEFARVIADELGVATDVLSPLEFRGSAEVSANETYITMMEDNAAALRQALYCE